MRELDLQINKVTDPVVRDGIQKLQEYLSRDIFGKFEGKFRWYSFSGAGSHSVLHTLGFKPSDIILTGSTAGAVTFDYAASTDKTITFTIATPGTVRLLVGRFK